MKIVFDPLGMWEEKHGSEPGLPGHSFTSKQLFWIAFAQVSCFYLEHYHLQVQANPKKIVQKTRCYF